MTPIEFKAELEKLTDDQLDEIIDELELYMVEYSEESRIDKIYRIIGDYPADPDEEVLKVLEKVKRMV